MDIRDEVSRTGYVRIRAVPVRFLRRCASTTRAMVPPAKAISGIALLLLAAGSEFACLSAAAHGAPPAPALSPAQAAAIRAAEKTGRAIFIRDHAAAVATDAAMELPSFREDRRIRGWVTEKQGNTVVVTFIDKTPAALYRVTVSDAGHVIGKVSQFALAEALSPYESDAVAARIAAQRMRIKPCARRYNYVVLPRGSVATNEWTVYLLPATRRQGVIPIGGTYRFEVDGTTVRSHRTFTHSCIALDNDPRASALIFSHLMDPTPTEVHVFWNLWGHKTMYVVTTDDGDVWELDKGRIRLVDVTAPKAAASDK